MREGSGVAIGIALGAFVFLAFLPFLLVVFLWVFFSIYGSTKGTAFGASTINLPLLFAGVAVITGALVVALMGVVSFIGRSLNPPRKRDLDQLPDSAPTTSSSR